MPDNSFEHNMSRQMGDFNYPASDAVWQKLEVNLQKRKKRRWAIIWFFSGLVLVGAGIYFMARPADTIREISLVSNNLKADNSENQLVKPENNLTEKILIPVSKSLKKGSKTEQFIVKRENEFDGQEISEKSTENIVVDSNIDKGVEVEKKEETPPVLINESISESNNMKDISDNAVADSGSVINVLNKQKQTDSLVIGKNDQKVATYNRQLSFGLRFEAGRSANSELNFAKSSSADRVSSPTSGGPPTYVYPFTQKPSFAWSFGGWVRKPISQKVNMQTGLSYHHYRTSASQGDSSNYTNTFHLLSVPVEMVLQFNKGKKLPVQWHFGIEPGWMVGSNAIVQDTSGFLFSDKSRINRFQLGIQTGVSFRFFQKTQYPIELGPVFQYMLTPAFKSGSISDGHLNFLGLRADWKIFNSGSKQR